MANWKDMWAPRPEPLADPAWMAAASRGDGERLSRMIQAGADLEAKNEAGMTAAMGAAWEGRANCLALLIQAGCDVDAKDAQGRTAAMCAASRGEVDCLGALIAAGCDLGARAAGGHTALDLAGPDSGAKRSRGDECERMIRRELALREGRLIAESIGAEPAPGKGGPLRM